MTSVSAFAPASVSNVTCGFDILGFTHLFRIFDDPVHGGPIRTRQGRSI